MYGATPNDDLYTDYRLFNENSNFLCANIADLKFYNEISNLGQIWVLRSTPTLSSQPYPPRLESLPLRPLRLLWTDMDGHIVTLLIYLTTITPVYNIIYIHIYIIYNI